MCRSSFHKTNIPFVTIDLDLPPNLPLDMLGFSEGSNVALELATTGRFRSVVLCSYGYTGILPELAVEKLRNVRVRVVHSEYDDVYDLRWSEKLAGRLEGETEFVRIPKGERVNHENTVLRTSRDERTWKWLLEG